jgi:pre-rRNA-processing protein IPI1
LIFCELISKLVPRANDPVLSSGLGPRQPNRGASHSKQATRALDTLIQYTSEYSTQLLRGETPNRPDTQTIGTKVITPETYVSLLPTIWALINSPGAPFTEEVLQACVEHGVRASSTSAVKRHTVGFIGRLLLVGLDQSTAMSV